MTATTSTSGLGSAGPRHESRGLFKSLFANFVASRELHAMNIVDGHLRSLDDAALTKLGFSPEMIRQLRAGHSVRPE